MWELDVKTYFGLLLVEEAEQLFKHGSPGLELQEAIVYTYFTKALLLESQVGISSHFLMHYYHTKYSPHVVLQLLLNRVALSSIAIQNVCPDACSVVVPRVSNEPGWSPGPVHVYPIRG